MNKQALAILAMAVVVGASAANLTWVGGSEGDWNTATNWDPQQVPTNSDTVFFDSSERITVNLGATQVFATLSVSNTPCLKFVGDANGSELQVQQDSKNGTLQAPIVFDENVRVHFLAGKQWNNYSVISFLGGLSAAGDAPLLAYGKYVIDGAVTMPKGLRFSSTEVDWREKSSEFNGSVTWEKSTFAPSGRPIKGTPAKFTGSPAIGGTAPLAFDCGGEEPDMVINQWVNVAEPVYRTFPVSFNWFALCSSADAFNNAAVGFLPGSGSHIELTGDVTSVAARDTGATGSEAAHGAMRLAFRGSGAVVHFSGSKEIRAVGDNTLQIGQADGVGYNALDISAGLDGEKTIRPFGYGNVFANDGHGIFIRAREPGLALANGFSYGNSVNNRNAYTFGFDGTNDLAVSGDFTLGTAYSMVPVIGDMTLTLTGTLNPKDKNFDFAGTGDVVMGPTSQYTGSTGTLGKHSSGSLTLQGTLAGSSYNRAYFSGGKTILDYTQNAASRLNSAKSRTLETPVALADALRLRGTELILKGGSVSETVGEGNGTTFQDGLTKIRRDGGTSTIYLGELSPSATATHGSLVAVDVEDGIASVDSALAGQTLKGAYTVDGDHFAAVDANGVITAADDTIATKYVGTATAARSVVDYLIFESTAEGQSFSWNGTSDGAFVANKDGMIFRGDYDYTIEGGWIGSASTYNGGLVFTCAGKGILTFTGKLSRYGFIKSGPGTFRHTGTSDLSQSLAIYEGVFEVASASSFSSKGSVYLNGGTLKTAVSATMIPTLSIGDNGGVIEVVANTTFTQTAKIVTTADNTSGPVVKRGGGTWLPSGDFQAQSELRIEEGTVRLGHEWAIGCSTNRTRAIAPTKILADGTLDVAGFKAHVGNFYLKGGKIIDSSEGGSLGAYTFYAESGEVDVPLTNVVNPCKENAFVANNLEKTTDGTVTLSAANTFTGTAFVHDGTLLLTGSLAGSAYVDGGVIEGSGSIAGYVYATKDGAISATPGTVLSFDDKLAVGEGGSLRVAATSGGVGTFALTSAEGAVYLGKDSRLDFDLRSGTLGALAGEHVIVDLPAGAKVEGEFANFVNGKYTDDNGNKYVVNYAGGDGNDIVLSARGNGFAIFVR